MLWKTNAFTKAPGEKPEADPTPYVLKQGSTILNVAVTVHRERAQNFKFARVWARLILTVKWWKQLSRGRRRPGGSSLVIRHLRCLGALISFKVNQWTLLVGTISLVYSISLGAVGQMPLDARQDREILLTAAQSVFAVVVLMNLNMNLWEAGGLFILFAARLVYPEIRVQVSILHIVLAVLQFRRTHNLLPLIREGLLFPSRSKK